MKLFKSIVKGGPVGLLHAIREAWIENQIRSTAQMLNCERDLHRKNMQQLHSELNRLLLRQSNATQRAASFWRGLS